MKVTDILAIYAALLSTIVFVWNIRRAIPRYKVEVVFGADTIDCEYVSGAYISVKNPSSHTVHLANISILYPFGKRNLFEKLKHALKYRRLPSFVGWCHSSLSNYDIDDKCPIALEPGTSIGVFVPEDVLEKIFQACLRPRDRFWDIPVPKIDSAFDNLFVPQPSWSPSTAQQLRKLVAAPYLAPI